jgi:hypothetical protein
LTADEAEKYKTPIAVAGGFCSQFVEWESALILGPMPPSTRSFSLCAQALPCEESRLAKIYEAQLGSLNSECTGPAKGIKAGISDEIWWFISTDVVDNNCSVRAVSTGNRHPQLVSN